MEEENSLSELKEMAESLGIPADLIVTLGALELLEFIEMKQFEIREREKRRKKIEKIRRKLLDLKDQKTPEDPEALRLVRDLAALERRKEKDVIDEFWPTL